MDYNPWLPYLATEYIIRNWPRVFEAAPRVFEWGSGDSTLFFLSLGAKIVSIEHDLEWYSKIKDILLQNNWKIEYNLIPYEEGEIGPDKANPLHYKSGSTQLGPVNFKNYCSIIDNYDLFDLILIDGMARASCLYHAVNHVKPGGCIVLDNVEREYYLAQTNHLFGNWEKGWERIEFMGYGPILEYQWKTLFLINKTKTDHET